jgi:hypothetical protein
MLRAGETQTLPSLADGSTTGALAIPLSTPPGALTATVQVSDSGLTGGVTSVAGANEADVLVVPATASDGIERSLDMSRPTADVEFSGAATSPCTPRKSASRCTAVSA